MSYIGNTPDQQAFTPAVDFFNGNGSTTAFTLSRPVASVAQVQAVIENVPQNPGDAFTVSGNTITFTSAPPSGTSNIYVYYTSPITQVIAPSQGTVGATQLDVTGGSGTGALLLPSGTTAQRPTGAAGFIRYNSTLANPEWFSPVANTWAPFFTNPVYAITFFIVAGGGAGAAATGSLRGGGGGGGGGVVQGAGNVFLGASYAVVVGAGAAATGSLGTSGASGSNSSFNFSGAAAAIGGGGGGSGWVGISGGSGGGAGDSSGFISGGAGTSGQGNRGGNTPGSGGNGAGGAGGGGAGSPGFDGNQTSGGSGIFLFTGSTYSAGGNGGSRGSSETGSAGGANTGNGGGGGGGTSGLGGAGGSGVVVIRYSGTPRATGGVITFVNGTTIHTFTTSGTFIA